MLSTALPWSVVKLLAFVATIAMLVYVIHEADSTDPVRLHFYIVAAFYGAYAGVILVMEKTDGTLLDQSTIPWEWLTGLVAGGFGVPLGLRLLVEYCDHKDPKNLHLLLGFTAVSVGCYAVFLRLVSSISPHESFNEAEELEGDSLEYEILLDTEDDAEAAACVHDDDTKDLFPFFSLVDAEPL